MLLGGSHTAMALGSARPMVTHRDSVLPHTCFATGFLSPCHDSPAGSGHSSSFWHLYRWPDGQPGEEHSPCQRVRQPPSFAKCCQTFLEMLPYLVASSCMCNFSFDLPRRSWCLSGHLLFRKQLQQKHVYKHCQSHTSQT